MRIKNNLLNKIVVYQKFWLKRQIDWVGRTSHSIHLQHVSPKVRHNTTDILIWVRVSYMLFTYYSIIVNCLLMSSNLTHINFVICIAYIPMVTILSNHPNLFYYYFKRYIDLVCVLVNNYNVLINEVMVKIVIISGNLLLGMYLYR